MNEIKTMLVDIRTEPMLSVWRMTQTISAEFDWNDQG